MVRDAIAADAVAIAGLLKPHVTQQILLHRSLEEIGHNIDKTLVCEEDGQIIGTVSLVFFSASLCEIRALAISDAAQGKGIGKELVLAVENKALKEECADLRNEVFALNGIKN